MSQLLFASSLVIRRITLQGFPTATLSDGISFTTTLPPPITTLLPIVTPGITCTPAPIHTLSPTVIGYAYHASHQYCLSADYCIAGKGSCIVSFPFQAPDRSWHHITSDAASYLFLTFYTPRIKVFRTSPLSPSTQMDLSLICSGQTASL